MSVPELVEPKRTCLTLDPGLVIERLILQRLSGLKRKRGQDWLRSLLVQGFLAEGRWLRSDLQGNRRNVVPRETTVPATPFAGWLGQAQPAEQPDAEATPAAVAAATPAPSIDPDAKPFAHLRKVIG
ncbi:MAG: hypothetical protein H6953_05030 [Chromatiaceae bacterium]|nr:hypothetical protein [Chromatiaceae bacterium]